MNTLQYKTIGLVAFILIISMMTISNFGYTSVITNTTKDISLINSKIHIINKNLDYYNKTVRYLQENITDIYANNAVFQHSIDNRMHKIITYNNEFQENIQTQINSLIESTHTYEVGVCNNNTLLRIDMYNYINVIIQEKEQKIHDDVHMFLENVNNKIQNITQTHSQTLYNTRIINGLNTCALFIFIHLIVSYFQL